MGHTQSEGLRLSFENSGRVELFWILEFSNTLEHLPEFSSLPFSPVYDIGWSIDSGEDGSRVVDNIGPPGTTARC